jgi:perosamine synthetase
VVTSFGRVARSLCAQPDPRADAEPTKRAMGSQENSRSIPAQDHPELAPILPLVSGACFFDAGAVDMRSVRDAGPRVELTSGTAAMALALRHARIGASDEVLLPAFLCRSMVEPVLELGAIPVYYKIHPDTSVDVRDITAKRGSRTRAVVVVHYFGFPQDMVPLRTLCDRFGLTLVEDCAHAFFGEIAGRPVGWYGDYAIASVRKFFPVSDGGYLISSHHALDTAGISEAGFMYNLKSAVDAIEEAHAFGRCDPVYWALALPLAAKKLFRRRQSGCSRDQARSVLNAGSVPTYEHLDAGSLWRKMSYPSRLVVRFAGIARIVRRRRENFLRLVEVLSGLANGRPLFSELPPSVVPYMFPFVVDEPERIFALLKKRGVPMFRWEDAQTQACTVSAAYSRKLLQLPCHQELRPDELVRMGQTIQDVMQRQS